MISKSGSTYWLLLLKIIHINHDTDIYNLHWWLGGLLVERRTSVSQIRGSIPRQVAAV